MKIFKGLLFISLLGVFSCSDMLEQSPSDSLPGEEAITTLDDLHNAVNGVYEVFISQYGWAGDFGLYADGRGGDTKLVNKSVNHFQPLAIFQTDANSGHADGVYQIFYTAIARANNIMLYTDNITDKESDIERYNDLLGQLSALRAVSHFEIARTYAQLPGVAADKDAANSGIVLSDYYYDLDTKLTRSTLTETYDFIISDLVNSIELLSTEKYANSGYINKWSALAILSRVYLYNEDYDNALECAELVISGATDYSLYTRDEFLNVWSTEGSSESLFELTTNDIYNADRNSIGCYTNPEGYAECAANDDFATWMLAQTDDIRSSAIVEKDDDGSFQAYYTTKYEGLNGATSPLYVNNPKVIRLAEVYLIAAEAKLQGGTYDSADEAVSYYNALRRNRIADYVDASSVTIDDILDERRRELFCENQRMFDLVRHKQQLTKLSATGGTMSYDDSRVIMAIPQRELDINSALTQNPNYN